MHNYIISMVQYLIYRPHKITSTLGNIIMELSDSIIIYL